MIRLKLLSKAIKEGVVTEKYPFKPIQLPPGFRGKPFIDPAKCIGCGACMNACPPNAITIEDDLAKGIRYVKLFVGRCIYCGRCQDVCPVGAVKLTEEFELATQSDEDLYEIVGLRMAKCSICGKYYATIRQVKHVSEKLPIHQREPVTICPNCRSKHAGYYISFARK